MKLRFYLRGLGIGMIVTALLMGFATKDQRAMTDEEIIQRATQLGMVAGNKTLAVEQTAAPTTEPTQKPTSAPTKEPVAEATAEPTIEPVAEQAIAPTPELTVSEAQTPEKTLSPQAEALEPKVLVIKGGESSVSVSNSLFELGLVTSAKEYDSYLCKNGFDKVISVGTYEIPVDASYEDIARIITGR